MENNDPRAPKNLDKLFGNVVDYCRDYGRKRIHVKVAKKEEDDKPNAMCPVCTRAHRVAKSIIVVGDNDIKSVNCPECQEQFDNGGIAIRCATDTRHAFVWSQSLVGHGPIITLTKDQFDAVMARVEEQKRRDNEGSKNDG